MSVLSKVYRRILEKKLREVVEKQLEDPQCGFRPNRSISDLIFTVRHLVSRQLNM